MAQVKIQSVIEHLDSQMRSALEATVNEVIPDAEVDRYALYRAFVRAVGRKCNTWERVSDNYVEVD